MKKNKINLGFTLMELLVVIGLISILSVAAIMVIDPIEQYKKANDARRKSDLSQLQKVFETYYGDNNHYPANTLDEFKIADPNGDPINWGGTWVPYMNIVPEDPDPSDATYIYVSTGQSYYLYTHLERGSKDPQACNGGGKCTNAPDVSCLKNGDENGCNFGVSSPNVSP